MFNNQFNDRCAPLNNKHLAEAQLICPKQVEFIDSLFCALSINFKIQVNLFITFILLKDLYDTGKRGILSSFGDILYVPLSIIAKTDNHEWTRFRPIPASEIHAGFLSFMMTESNRIVLNDVLSSFNLSFSQAGNFGILFGNPDDISSFKKTVFFKTRKEIGNYAESMGMPASNVIFSQIPVNNTDLGPLEIEFYKNYERFFEMMSYQPEDYFIDNNIDSLWNSISLRCNQKVA